MRLIGYTTYGSIRGGCGHNHATPEEADACLAQDGSGCRTQGGYSDRATVGIGADGYLYYYTGSDRAAEDEWVPGPGGRSGGAAKWSGNENSR